MVCHERRRTRESPPHAPEGGWSRRLLGPFHVTGVFWFRPPQLGIAVLPGWALGGLIALFSTFFWIVLRKIRAAIASNLEAVLHRQVAAQVLHQYPKYRSQQDRFWHQPMPIHLAALLRAALEEEGMIISRVGGEASLHWQMLDCVADRIESRALNQSKARMPCSQTAQ